MDFILDFMEENEFNAVRLHFSIEMIQNNPKTNVDCKSNKDLCHLKALELMEAVIDRYVKNSSSLGDDRSEVSYSDVELIGCVHYL